MSTRAPTGTHPDRAHIKSPCVARNSSRTSGFTGAATDCEGEDDDAEQEEEDLANGDPFEEEKR